MFGLMFRNEMIDMQRPVLHEAAREAMRVMAAIIGAKDAPADDAPVSLGGAEAMRITAAWGYVHGLAILLIDQRLGGIIKVTPDFDDPLAAGRQGAGRRALRLRGRRARSLTRSTSSSGNTKEPALPGLRCCPR
jgi:hypothetical protein